MSIVRGVGQGAKQNKLDMYSLLLETLLAYIFGRIDKQLQLRQNYSSYGQMSA